MGKSQKNNIADLLSLPALHFDILMKSNRVATEILPLPVFRQNAGK